MLRHDKSEIVYPDPGIWTKTSMIQLWYGFLASLTSVTIGLAFGFSSIITQMSITDLKIAPAMSNASFIVSVLALATALGCLISGYIEDSFGRRSMFALCEVPMAVGWIFTGFANSTTDLIIGRIMVGIGCGMAIAAPRVYMTEITLPNIRGVVGSWPAIAIAIGITMQASLGSVLKWNELSFFNGGYTIALLFLSLIFPETPYFVLMNDTPDNTIKVLRKFRAASYNVEAELEQMLEYKQDNDIHGLTLKERVKILFGKSACRPFWIVTIYVAFSQCSGTTIILMWGAEILQASHSSVKAPVGGILLGVTRFFSGILFSVLILKYPRRPLALVSSLGVSAVCLTLGMFLKYVEETSIFPQLCYMAYLVFANIGYITIPMILVFEMAPLQVRGLLGCLTLSFMNILVFLVNQSYVYVENTIGFENTIIGFGLTSLLGSVYLYFFLPETSDLTLQEIEEYYNERRPTLTSQRRIVSMQAMSRMDSNTSRSLIRIKR